MKKYLIFIVFTSFLVACQTDNDVSGVDWDQQGQQDMYKIISLFYFNTPMGYSSSFNEVCSALIQHQNEDTSFFPNVRYEGDDKQKILYVSYGDSFPESENVAKKHKGLITIFANDLLGTHSSNFDISFFDFYAYGGKLAGPVRISDTTLSDSTTLAFNVSVETVKIGNSLKLAYKEKTFRKLISCPRKLVNNMSPDSLEFEVRGIMSFFSEVDTILSCNVLIDPDMPLIIKATDAYPSAGIAKINFGNKRIIKSQTFRSIAKQALPEISASVDSIVMDSIVTIKFQKEADYTAILTGMLWYFPNEKSYPLQMTFIFDSISGGIKERRIGL